MDFLGIKRIKRQILQMSQMVNESIGINQKNTIYISGLQNEIEYLRKHLKLETRSEYFAKMEKEQKDQLEKDTKKEIAKMNARMELAKEKKIE